MVIACFKSGCGFKFAGTGCIVGIVACGICAVCPDSLLFKSRGVLAVHRDCATFSRDGGILSGSIPTFFRKGSI